MKTPSSQKDLVVLCADRNTLFALRGVLSRTKALGIRSLSADLFVHPERDPGVFRLAHDYLRPFVHSHKHALVLLDREGSGCRDMSRIQMEERIDEELRLSGWKENDAASIVIDPELEIWVWSNSSHVDTELGWTDPKTDVRKWLHENGFWRDGTEKPDRPKEAVEAVLKKVRKARSSSLYESLATKVSLSRCADETFLKLKSILATWFAGA